MIRIINADVIDGLRSLPEKTVHCVVTSPPYWGLRDYGIEGQIGLEPTPEEYLEKMVKVFREVKRVLRDDGTLWLNIGDSYANAQPRGRMEDQGDLSTGDHGELIPKRDWSCWSLKQKDLVGMCWRVAFALQSEGWYLRSDIIWAKPNPMPESITDRPTRSHEYVFLFAKSARYFYDADAVREKQDQETRYANTFRHGRYVQNCAFSGNIKPPGELLPYKELDGFFGRNRRDVWTIATQPTPEAHFATFPEALVEPCIKAGTSERGCCSVCGAPWIRAVEKGTSERPNGDQLEEFNHKRGIAPLPGQARNRWSGGDIPVKPQLSVDWQPSCTCNAETVPCVVLDPFGGSGTVAKVARDLNRDAVLIEINPAYVEIARRKLRADEQLFENVKVITA